MAYSLLQSCAGASVSAQTNITYAPSLNLTNGSRLFVFTTLYVTTTALTDVSVSDSVNGAYTKLVGADWSPFGSDHQFTSIWSVVNAATTKPTVTVSPPANTGACGTTAQEYTGLFGASPVDVSAVGTGLSGVATAASTGTTGATTGANELILSVVGDAGSTATFSATTGNFTKDAGASVDGSAAASIAVGHGTATVQGNTQTGSWSPNFTDGGYIACIAVIKLASSFIPVKPVMVNQAIKRGYW